MNSLRRLGSTIRRSLYGRFAKGRLRELQRRSWESAWADEGYAPPWFGRGVSKEIVAAVDEGWFAEGRPALDIGCGQGEVAAWLAERGFPTVGVDIASTAVARARSRHGERPGRLDFLVLDLCRQAPPDREYAVVVDRGCFHQVPRHEHRVFVEHLLSVCARDARLLLFLAAFRRGIELNDDRERRRQVRKVEDAFGAGFRIERIATTFLDPYQGEQPDRALPGLCFWMSRR
jgi:SAM-dependent methyltransferase